MSGARLIAQLACIIRLMVEYPQGLSMLIGTVDGPTCEDIAEMIETVRQPQEILTDPVGLPLFVPGGERVSLSDCMIDSEDRFNRIIKRVGGWEHIRAVVRDWKKNYQTRWAAIVDYTRWSPSRVDGLTLDDLADRRHISRATFHRIIQNFPQELATAIMQTPVGETFDLGDVDELPAV